MSFPECMESEVKVLCIRCYNAKESKCPDRLTCFLADYDPDTPYFWAIMFVDGKCIKDTGALASVVEKLQINVQTKAKMPKTNSTITGGGKWDF